MMNFNENVDKGMGQMNAGAEQLRSASEAFGTFWADQTRSNLESAMAWQKQTNELFSGVKTEGEKVSSKERARLESMSADLQTQFQAGVEQANTMARSISEAGEAMFSQNFDRMNEMMNGMGNKPAAAPAKKTTTRSSK